MISPVKSANKISHVLNKFHEQHRGQRFPVDLDSLALHVHEFFGWTDSIVKVEGHNISGFDGMLASNGEQWMILYNSGIRSSGRIRFTKAHELGHYVLHRERQSEFNCTRDDMLSRNNGSDIESEADVFASTLLMPIDDFRKQVDESTINFDLFSHCADRYGVSLTAVVLKWLTFTHKNAIFLKSNDGFVNWACSSEPAFEAGAYFKTRSSVIEVPIGSCASVATNAGISSNELPVKSWFPRSHSIDSIKEWSFHSEHYDATFALLLLPKNESFYPEVDS